MQFTHNGYYRGSIPLNLKCKVIYLYIKKKNYCRPKKQSFLIGSCPNPSLGKDNKKRAKLFFYW